MKILTLITFLNCLTYNVKPYVILPPIVPVVNTFSEDCLLYGIDIDEGWELLNNGTDPLTFKHDIYTRTDNDYLQYQTDIYHAILKYSDTNVYAYLSRMVVNPICKERNFGFFGINSHSDDWYFRSINISLDLPQDNPEYTIGQWSPMNEPNVYDSGLAITIGYNAFEISVSFTIEETLNIISRTNPATNHFETEYSYNPLDEYSHNSIVFYTAFRFGLPVELDIEDFPMINITTTYYGRYYFGNETRTFSVCPYAVEVVLPPVGEY